MLIGWGSLKKTVREPLPARTAFQMAFNTDLDFYSWFARDEVTYVREAFHRFMETNMSELPLWYGVVDFAAEFGAGLTDTDVAFIDIGGGQGHQAAEFKARLPDVPGRVIHQDLPDVLATAMDTKGVEKMVYDYRTEQPIKGKSTFPDCTD